MRTLELPDLEKVGGGKVREIFAVQDELLLVATDRISAFDVVLPDAIPDKGRVLTQMSAFWFGELSDVVPNHFLSADVADFPPELQPHADQLRGRATLVRRCRPLPVECVVRGYLAGSGWKEYRQNGSVCGISLPEGLVESARLPEPIFTPATKATDGHDENISFERTVEIIGEDLASRVREISLRLYRAGAEYALERGLIICDTKFEFGLYDGDLMLIDEVLTPDSSRFWPSDAYQRGRPQPSFDKQFVRDYLESVTWDKTPPGPRLPASVIESSRDRYLEAYKVLTGRELVT